SAGRAGRASLGDGRQAHDADFTATRWSLGFEATWVRGSESLRFGAPLEGLLGVLFGAFEVAVLAAPGRKPRGDEHRETHDPAQAERHARPPARRRMPHEGVSD